jgi:hypothetical protein
VVSPKRVFLSTRTVGGTCTSIWNNAADLVPATPLASGCWPRCQSPSDGCSWPASRPAVLEGGDGPPVVLLHGPGALAAEWMRVIPDLVTTQRVVAPDLPGHGASEVASARYGWTLHVIENAGNESNLEQPEAFLEALRPSLAT